ncbi:hypothetical protein CQ059_05375 [Brucella pseudogrignonensis]|nr:hypothetical protein CQ059_05375 [Brucella pseudogrignonensis]PRA43110.1 hypothetical protein CQ063_01860 [Brucella pseudogrignonensis]PRA72420.1 hypothetical protein CQ055_03720 [Brucella pseudogrignonensis]
MNRKTSRRRTSKFWLAVTLLVSFTALFMALWFRLETAAAAITVMIPAVYGAYVGIGHMDYRQTFNKSPEDYP